MNVVGPSLLTAAALPCLAAAKGTVINASHGIRVNAVASGPTESDALTGMMGLSLREAEAVENQERERIPLGRRGNPGDVARWIIQLADPASEWVTGQVIAVAGGLAVT